mgnify:CR=1 FL=1
MAHLRTMSSTVAVLKLKNARLEAQLGEAHAATRAMHERIKQLERQLEAKELPMTSISSFVPVVRRADVS